MCHSFLAYLCARELRVETSGWAGKPLLAPVGLTMQILGVSAPEHASFVGNDIDQKLWKFSVTMETPKTADLIVFSRSLNFFSHEGRPPPCKLRDCQE